MYQGQSLNPAYGQPLPPMMPMMPKQNYNYGQQQYPQQQGYVAHPGQAPAQYYNQYGAPQPYQYPPGPQAYPYPAAPQAYSYSNNPISIPNFKFTEKSMRNAFVCKVYAILTAQMILTIGIMVLFIFVAPVRAFVERNKILYIVAIITVLALIIILGCFTAPRRSFPLNYVLLGVFTLAEGFLVGVISVKHDTTYVLFAGIITLAVVVSITVFAFQTKIDFTYLSGAMLIVSIVFLGFGIIAAIIQSKILRLVYCCIGTLIFSMFLLIDTQMMLGGSHQYSISPEDYVFCALNLYVDIVQIFLMILGITSSSD